MQDGIQVDLRLQDSGSLKATAEVTFSTPPGPVTVKGFKVVQAEGQQPWVSPPSKDYTKDGQRKFQKMVELPRPVMRAVSDAVLKEYRVKLGQ